MHGSIHLFERLPQVDPFAAEADDARLPSARRGEDRPLVGLIRNARSYRNKAADTAEAALEDVIVTTPEKRSELPGILERFAAERVDTIAIDGGDGTVRDVITCGAGIFGETWPRLIVLPNGKTNALAYDLGVPVGWSLTDALAAMRRGNHVRRRPLVISERDDASAQVRGFIMGTGIFNACVDLGQRSHDLGAFNSAAVAVTAGWSVLQALLGGEGNAWRQGSRMAVREGDGTPVPHLGGLPADERYLTLATTLESFPAGIDVYRGIDAPLKLAVMDNARRGLLLRIGALARGTASAATRSRGVHLLGGEAFEIDLSDTFILDGEAFPAGNYRLSAGRPLRFVVP